MALWALERLPSSMEVAAKLLRDSMDVVEKHYHALLERPKPL